MLFGYWILLLLYFEDFLRRKRRGAFTAIFYVDLEHNIAKTSDAA